MVVSLPAAANRHEFPGEGTPERQVFLQAFKADITQALAVDESRLAVVSLAAGSTLVTFFLLPSTDPELPSVGAGPNRSAAVELDLDSKRSQAMTSCVR